MCVFSTLVTLFRFATFFLLVISRSKALRPYSACIQTHVDVQRDAKLQNPRKRKREVCVDSLWFNAKKANPSKPVVTDRTNALWCKSSQHISSSLQGDCTLNFKRTKKKPKQTDFTFALRFSKLPALSENSALSSIVRFNTSSQ